MDRKRYETGSRNVFKDIGIPNSEEHRIKAQLVFNIDAILKDRGLKQGRRPIYLASASLIYPGCCAGSSGSFPWNAF
jgi:hypothetical protein